MGEILRDVSASSLREAAFQALMQFFVDVARLRPEEWRLEDTGPLLLFYGGGPWAGTTVILHARASATEHDLRAVRERFAVGHLICLTHDADGVGDLHERLTSLGFVGTKTPAMAAALDTLPMGAPLPPDLRIEAVEDDEAHAILIAIQIETLGEDFAPRAAMKRVFGLAPDGPVRHLLGWVGNRPVASATVMCTSGVASLWGIGTTPDVRGQGIGRAMTLHACQWARHQGYQAVVLYATPLGLPVYARLGFRSCGHLGLYVASPIATTAC